MNFTSNYIINSCDMAHIQIKISMDMFFKVINAFTNSVRSSMNPDITTFNWCVWMKAQKGET